MSVNDKKRREIAQRLRKLEIGVIGTVIPTVELVKNILKAIDYSHSNAMTPYGRLADLIEPEPERTCRPVVADDGSGAWGVYCLECGYRFAGPYGKREVPEHMATRRDIMPRYCSNCGARVEVDK